MTIIPDILLVPTALVLSEPKIQNQQLRQANEITCKVITCKDTNSQKQ